MTIMTSWLTLNRCNRRVCENITNQLGRIFVVTAMWVSGLRDWRHKAVQERLFCVKLVTSRHVKLRYVTLRYIFPRLSYYRILTSLITWIRRIIMLTNTHLYYLSEVAVSLSHFGIQFTNLHFIIKFPSLSRSLTCLLLILTTFIIKSTLDEQHCRLCCILCGAVYSQWWVCARLYF